jgi:hypothetical protein
MNGKTAHRALKPRDLALRLGLVVLYFALLALVYVRGRTHTLLLDNKDVDGGRLTAFEDVMVSVDGKEAVELLAGDRDMAVVKSQSHRVALEVTADGKKIEKRITLPIGEDMLLLSLPKLAAGEEPAIEKFTPLDQAPPAEEGNAVSPDEPEPAPVEGARPEAAPEAAPAP